MIKFSKHLFCPRYLAKFYNKIYRDLFPAVVLNPGAALSPTKYLEMSETFLLVTAGGGMLLAPNA